MHLKGSFQDFCLFYTLKENSVSRWIFSASSAISSTHTHICRKVFEAWGFEYSWETSLWFCVLCLVWSRAARTISNIRMVKYLYQIDVFFQPSGYLFLLPSDYLYKNQFSNQYSGKFFLHTFFIHLKKKNCFQKHYSFHPFLINAVLLNFLLSTNPEKKCYGFHKNIRQQNFQHWW